MFIAQEGFYTFVVHRLAMAFGDDTLSNIAEIFDKVCEHFECKSEYISAFVKHTSREECWFAAEITWLLDKMDVKFDREKEYLPEKYIDFRLDLDDGEHFIEMKALLHGPKPNLKRITDDYQRLITWQHGHKWLLMIAYPYSKEQWQTWFSQMMETFPRVQPTKMTDFPLSKDQKCTIIIWRIL